MPIIPNLLPSLSKALGLKSWIGMEKHWGKPEHVRRCWQPTPTNWYKLTMPSFMESGRHSSFRDKHIEMKNECGMWMWPSNSHHEFNALLSSATVVSNIKDSKEFTSAEAAYQTQVNIQNGIRRRLIFHDSNFFKAKVQRYSSNVLLSCLSTHP